MRFEKHEVQVINNRILVKQYHNENKDSFNWVELAVFNFIKDVCQDPNLAAKKYAESIVK